MLVNASPRLGSMVITTMRGAARPLSNAQEGGSFVLVSESDIAVDDRFGRESGRIYLTGMQALARLPVESRRADHRANVNTAGFVSGYEGSPLAGYDLELGRQSDREQAIIRRFPTKP
jgi:indolepyruvate ferredoxin oxidoreductase